MWQPRLKTWKVRRNRAEAAPRAVARIEFGSPAWYEQLEQRLHAYAVVLILGGVAAVTGRGGLRDCGWAAVGVSGAGLASGVSRWLRAHRLEIARREAEARRKELREQRQRRDRVRRDERQARRELKVQARLHTMELLAERRHAEQAEQRERERRSRLQVERQTHEAARLAALSDDRLVEEVAALFVMRGAAPATPGKDAQCDLLLPYPDRGSTDVARCVPQGRVAGAIDVRSLEQWRQAVGAPHAYLIALAGFSPAAVRAASGLPITLVEAYLLAHWRIADTEVSPQ